MNTLIQAEDLKETLAQGADIALFEATYFLPTMGRDAQGEFAAHRLPGAQFFDIDLVADTASPLPHMLPSKEIFQAEMQKLGLKSGQQVVVYDRAPFLSSARAWWMLRLFGHDKVALLDGGLAAWQAAGGTLETTPLTPPASGDFIAAEPRADRQIDLAGLRHLLDTNQAEQIADARPAERFEGRATEPRPGVQPGHIPGSRNVPLIDLIGPDGRLKPTDELSAIFTSNGIDITQPVITSCGSGVTAAGLTLALLLLGQENVRLYDGSWTEYGGSGAPTEKGPAT